nr:hypothetical protein [Tanacetum cinerariifolium]
MQATGETNAVVTKERLTFLVNQEIMEDSMRVEDYKRMARQLKDSVRRRSGYIGALKAHPSGVDSCNRSVMQATGETNAVVTKERLTFLVNQEIMEDSMRVEDYKRMARQLKDSVRRRSGYIGALKAHPSGVDSCNRILGFLDLEAYVTCVFLCSFAIFNMTSSLPLIHKLAYAAGSDVMKDQLVVLFEREAAESVGKIAEFRRLCIELRTNIKLRNSYISELMLYRSCDDILGSITMLRTMQLNDTENDAHLLSIAQETQRKKIAEERSFLNMLRDQCEDVKRNLSKLHAMICELEPIDHRLDVVDPMASLRDAVREEDDKLMYLLQMVDLVGNEIRKKEGHADMMDLCD